MYRVCSKNSFGKCVSLDLDPEREYTIHSPLVNSMFLTLKSVKEIEFTFTQL